MKNRQTSEQANEQDSLWLVWKFVFRENMYWVALKFEPFISQEKLIFEVRIKFKQIKIKITYLLKYLSQIRKAYFAMTLVIFFDFKKSGLTLKDRDYIWDVYG